MSEPHDEDECVCGTTRQAHYGGTGSSMLNIYHAYSGQDLCKRFQLYRAAPLSEAKPTPLQESTATASTSEPKVTGDISRPSNTPKSPGER